MPAKDTAAALRAALAAHVRATYGVAISDYRQAWLSEPVEGGTRYPYEGLDLVNLYDSLPATTT